MFCDPKYSNIPIIVLEMTPNVVFSCNSCNKILRTQKGIEDHIKKIHGKIDVTNSHYKQVLLKESPPDSHYHKELDSDEVGNMESQGEACEEYKKI